MPFTIDIRVAGPQSLKVACNVSIASSQQYMLSDKTVMLRKPTRYWRIFREGARRALSHKNKKFPPCFYYLIVSAINLDIFSQLFDFTALFRAKNAGPVLWKDAGHFLVSVGSTKNIVVHKSCRFDSYRMKTLPVEDFAF